jgi:hypothetical protein
VRTSDGAVLGRTPWYVEQPAATGAIDIAVRKSGWVEQHVTLDRAANSSLHVQLKRAHRRRGPKEEELDVRPLQ